MTRYAAFLRGINLGNRRLTNDELRVAFAGPDVSDVATYRASGNVVFTHEERAAGRALEGVLEARLAHGLGFETTTFVRPLPRLSEIVALPALEGADGEGFKPHVLFLKREADLEVRERLAALESPDDRFIVVGAEVVWLRRGGLHDAPIQPPDLVRALGGADYTQRTVGTVRGVVEKFGRGGGAR